MTKKEMFAIIRDVISSTPADNADEMLAFIDHEVELLNKKASSARKPTKTQIENEGFKATIVAYLTEVDTLKCIKEIQSEVPEVSELSNQRITHMLTDLRKDGKVARTYVKKVAYFALGCEDESEGE